MENELKHSIDFIKKKTSNKTGFSIPENYFNALEKDIETKIIEESFNKKTPFKVSNSYFDDIESIVLEKTVNYENTSKVINFKQRVLQIIPYAAVASIILFIGLNTFIFTPEETVSFDTISDTEIEYWLNENSISTNEIATLLENEIADENIFSFTNIDDDIYEDYINSIDNAAFLDELN